MGRNESVGPSLPDGKAKWRARQALESQHILDTKDHKAANLGLSDLSNEELYQLVRDWRIMKRCLQIEQVDFVAATDWLKTKYKDRTWSVRGGVLVVGLVVIAGTCWWNPAGWGAIATGVAGGVEALATGAVLYNPSVVTDAPETEQKIRNGKVDPYHTSQLTTLQPLTIAST